MAKNGHANGRPASWDKAMPFLTKALTDVDEANPRSVDSAQKAADALGEARLPEGLDALIEIATKPVTKKLIAAQVSAIRAIGKFDNDKSKAAGALIKIIDRDPPPNPRTGAKDQQRALEEKFGLFLGVSGAAVNALGDLRVPTAADTLVKALYRTPELFTQVRRALVACGPNAEAALRKVLAGTNNDINQLFKDKKLDKYCGDKGDATGDACQDVSAKDFYAAVVLGDFYDPASTPDLLAALKRPPLPVYYTDDQPSPNTQYNAIFDALRKIGSPEGAADVRAMWMAARRRPAPRRAKGAEGRAGRGTGRGGRAISATRILAIGAYPFLTRDDTGANELGKIAADNKADDNLRTRGGDRVRAAVARSRTTSRCSMALAQKYFDASAKKRAEADGKPKADSDAADKDLEKAKKKVDDAKAAALKATHDHVEERRPTSRRRPRPRRRPKTTSRLPRRSTRRRPRRSRRPTARPRRTRATRACSRRTSRGSRSRSAASSDLKCYAATLKEKPDDAAKNCAPYLKDIKDWTADEKLGLLDGEVERAMLEIGKMGNKAEGLTETLLDNAKSDDRIIRQSIMLALPKIAKVPCDNCETKLAAAVTAGEGKVTLGDLNVETTMLRNYFAWAGGNTPSTPADSSAPPEARR